MTYEATKFFVSRVTFYVTNYRLIEFVVSYNHQQIPNMFFYCFVLSVTQQYQGENRK